MSALARLLPLSVFNRPDVSQPDIGPGDLVFAPWEGERRHYPAVVVAAEDTTLYVAYMCGGEGRVPIGSVDWCSLEIGEQVEVNWGGLGQYCRAIVRDQVGHAVFVQYLDGGESWTTLSMLRVRYDFR